MKLIQIPAPDFDLEKTLGSGQVFHWERTGQGFAGTIANEPIYIEQTGETLRVGGKTPRLVEQTVHYFALDHPLAEICLSFPSDDTMTAARDFCRGLRIMRQPKWECLAMFICSSMKQVAHIRQISQALRMRFGEPREIGAYKLFTFPSAARLADCSEKELRGCALGYRAPNLLSTARLVSSQEADLEGWPMLNDNDLRARLCALPGVGAKVANCVMLFAYERLRAFPIDVWIERVLREQYFPRKRRVTAQQLRDFASRYFGEHGGYAQQYLFHHARTNKNQSVRRGLPGAKNERRGRSRHLSRSHV
jgi:N-glycosylase/DNA lyase